MAPTFNKIYSNVSEPYKNGEINITEAFQSGSNDLKDFMIKNTVIMISIMFTAMSGKGEFESTSDIPLYIVLPAYMTSELKTAFQIGFLYFSYLS